MEEAAVDLHPLHNGPSNPPEDRSEAIAPVRNHGTSSVQLPPQIVDTSQESLVSSISGTRTQPLTNDASTTSLVHEPRNDSDSTVTVPSNSPVAAQSEDAGRTGLGTSIPGPIPNPNRPPSLQPFEQDTSLQQSNRRALWRKSRFIPSALRKCHPHPKQWRSRTIKWPWLSLILFLTLSIVIAICTLDSRSRESSGFASLGNPPSFLTNHPALAKALWSQGILYTTLPAFMMTLYTMMISSSVTSFVELQPFLDLNKGGPAETTILLDYRAYPILYSFYFAFRNKHNVLGVYMLLSVLLTVAVVPLTAFLFTDASFNFDSAVSVTISTSFDDMSVLDIPDLRLMMDVASAFRIYDGHPPPWTDGEYAFPKILTPPGIDAGPSSGNLTVQVTAYSAYVNCRIIPETDYHVTRIVDAGGQIPGLTLQISSNDRGCDITNNLNIRNKTLPGVVPNTTYLTTWSTVCLDGSYSRLSILSALYNQGSYSLTNLSLISCIPSYWQSPGNLSMTNPGSQLSTYSFQNNDDDAKSVRPQLVSTFLELNLHSIGGFNPTSDLEANDFGRLVYTLSKRYNPVSPLLPEELTIATQFLFSSIYSVLVSTTVLRPILKSVNSTGILSTQHQRLVVVSPVAYIIVFILCGICLSIVTMFWYGMQPSILREEPIGLLSHAVIMYDSEIMNVVKAEKGSSTCNGAMVKTLKTEKHLEGVTFRMTDLINPTRARIVTEREILPSTDA